jgi:hypothetical protein
VADGVSERVAAEPRPAGRTKGVQRVRRYLEMLYIYWVSSGNRVAITTHPDGRAPSGPVITFVRACAAPVVATKDQASITPDALRELLRKWPKGS